MSSISGQQDFDNVAKDSLSHAVIVEESMGRSLGISRAKLLRKIDLMLMPMMLLTYGMQYLDKAVLGFAAVYTLQEDNHLIGQDYSWVNSVFYFGYLGFQYPLLALVPKFRIERYLGFVIAAWGLTLMMTNFSHSFAGLVIARIIMGALESLVAPSFLIIVSQWYTRDEQPIRQSVWFCGTPLFAIFGGLIGYAVGHTNSLSIASWRVMFLIFGGVTFVWGLIFAFIFPGDPDHARFFTPSEQEALSLTVNSQATSGKGPWKWSQAKEAMMDPKTYVFFTIGLCNTIPAGALSGFSSLIIKNLGFSAVDTQLIGIPANVIQLASLIFAGIICTKIPNLRLYAMSLCCIPSIIGTALLHTLPSHAKWGRVVSLWIIYTNSVGLSVSFAVIGGNVAGATKKATVTFLLFLGYCAGSIAAPQLFIASEQSRGYPTGIKAMLGCFCVLFIMPFVLRGLYTWENKRRDRAAMEGEVQPDDTHLEDATDIQMRSFRYVL